MDASLYSTDGEKPKFHIGQKVRLLNDVKNDGTYPFGAVGTLLMPAGSEGHVRKIGDYLQTITIYEVHFFNLEMPVEIVGCREHELEPLEDFVDPEEEEREWFRNYQKSKEQQKI